MTWGAADLLSNLWPALCLIPAWPLLWSDRLGPVHERPLAQDIAIIIPARDEERNIGRLLTSLDRQTTKPSEIVVVDDGSTDRTAEIARAHGAHVIRAGDLPKGWLGKPWACWRGARATASKYLLFLDADMSLGRTALARLGARLKPGMCVSAQPWHRVYRAHEQLAGFFNLAAALSLADAAPLPRSVGGFGPLLLCARADYDRVGGHKAVRAELLEHLHLVELLHYHGVAVQRVQSGSVVSYRMYPTSLSQLWNGFVKHVAAGAASSPWRGSIMALLAVGAGIACGDLVHALSGGGALGSALAAYGLVVVQLFLLLRRVGRFSPLLALLYPIGLFFFTVACIVSAARLTLRQPLRWKDRDVTWSTERKP